MNRVRSNGAFYPNGQLDYWHLNNDCSTNPSWTKTLTRDGPFIGKIATMTDTVVPNFRKRVSMGEVFFNPLESSTDERVSIHGARGAHIKSVSPSCSSPLMYHEYKKEGDVFGYEFLPSTVRPGMPSPPYRINDGSIANAVAEVSTKVASQRGRSDSNLWETLAEAHKAAALFQQLGKRAIKVLTTLKGSPNEWLAYRYGLRPIISDTENVLKHMTDITGKVRKTSRSKSVLTDNSEIMVNSIPQDYILNHYTVQNFDEVVIRGMSLDEFMAEFESNIGFTAKGLLTLPWELIPYSFVVDWFVNIGDFLGAYAPAFGYNQLGSCYTITRTRRTVWKSAGSSMNTGSYTVERPWSGECSWTQTTKSRRPLASPQIVIKPDFRFDTFNRAADAFALAAQQLLRNPPKRA